MQTIIDIFPPNFDKTAEDFSSKYGITAHENKVELHHLFVARLKDYDSYIADRDQVRKVRYATQTLLKPNKEED